MLVGADEVARARGGIVTAREVAVAIEEILADDEPLEAGEGRRRRPVSRTNHARRAADRIEEPHRPSGAVEERRIGQRRSEPRAAGPRLAVRDRERRLIDARDREA